MIVLLILDDGKVALIHKIVKVCDISRVVICHGNHCHGNWEKDICLNSTAKNRNRKILCAHIKGYVALRNPSKLQCI